MSDRTWFGHTADYDAYELEYMRGMGGRIAKTEHADGCKHAIKPFNLDCPLCALLNEVTLVHAAKVLLDARLRDPVVFGFLPGDDTWPSSTRSQTMTAAATALP